MTQRDAKPGGPLEMRAVDIPASSLRIAMQRVRQAINTPRRAALARRAIRDYELAVSESLAQSHLREVFSARTALPPCWGTGMSERIVEFPWVVAALEHEAGLTLDAGSTLNHAYVLDYVQQATSDLHIVTLAPEAESFPERGISYIYADLRDLPMRDNLYDTVVCLSTLEHVGMDVSGYNARTPVASDPQRAALEAARELRRVVRAGGRILISVPFGQAQNLGWLRQFDEPSLHELVAAFEPASVDMTVFRYHGTGWQVSSLEEAAGSRSQPYWASAVVCAEMTT